MVTEDEILLVDAGNTSIKFVTLNEVRTALYSCLAPDACFRDITKIGKITHIFLANVGNDSIEGEFSAFCQQHAVELHIISTEKCQFSLTNAYSDVTKMGVDRWLAMLAAHEMTSMPFAVIDIGTAITCDFVDNSQHLGGWIVPGYDLMKDALVKNTVRVFADAQIPSEFGVGKSTQDCVAMGCQAAVRGVYLSAVDYLSNKQTEFSIIIGGGGKNMLAFAQFDGSIHVANLVVHGLARYARKQFPALVSDR